MHSLFDYIAWRGDLTFCADPPNAVDSLIFCCLSYIRFSDIVPPFSSPDSILLKDAADRFLALPKDKRLVRTPEDEKLLEVLSASRRFANVRLSHYADRFDHRQEKQFAAVTALLDNGDAYLAFRGTDNTLVGWKEDFNMAFLPVVAAQQDALGYLETVAPSIPGRLIPGGHSKGGNLAVYAAARCSAALQDRICAVYNHDGPGFHQEMMDSSGYQSILPRIRTLIPQSSVIGMLLDHEEPYTVIHSSQLGIMQHNPYTWNVLGPDFMREENVTHTSLAIDRTLKNWVASMTPEQRGDFINGLYQIFDATDAVRISDLPKLWLRNFDRVSNAWKNTPQETRHLFFQTFSRLVDAAVKAAGQ